MTRIDGVGKAWRSEMVQSTQPLDKPSDLHVTVQAARLAQADASEIKGLHSQLRQAILDGMKQDFAGTRELVGMLAAEEVGASAPAPEGAHLRKIWELHWRVQQMKSDLPHAAPVSAKATSPRLVC